MFKPDGGGDIWITELERAINTKFTFDLASHMMPAWSHDGKQIAFVSNRKGGVFNIYVKASNGIGEDQVLLETPNNKAIWDWSADGRFILYEEIDPTRRETSGRCHLLETGSRCGCSRRRRMSSPRRFHQTGDGSPTHRMRAGSTGVRARVSGAARQVASRRARRRPLSLAGAATARSCSMTAPVSSSRWT